MSHYDEIADEIAEGMIFAFFLVALGLCLSPLDWWLVLVIIGGALLVIGMGRAMTENPARARRGGQ